MESFLCRFPVIQDVPEQHKGAWASAYSQVLAVLKEAENDSDRDRALMWLGFLPQCLL